jgi:hypothetical protein
VLLDLVLVDEMRNISGVAGGPLPVAVDGRVDEELDTGRERGIDERVSLAQLAAAALAESDGDLRMCVSGDGRKTRGRTSLPEH